MNYRERVFVSVDGSEGYPVPTDVMENLIHWDLEDKLCKHFGLPKADHEGLLQALNAHMRWGKPAYIGPELEEAPVQPHCTFPAKKATRNIWGGWAGLNTYSDEFDRPLKNVTTITDIESHRWPDPDWFDYTRIGMFEDNADEYLSVSNWAERHRDYVRVAGGFEPIFSRVMDLCGMESGLMLMATPDLAEAMVTHIGDFLEEYYTRMAQAGQGCIDILAFGDDFAGQNAMLVSPDSWRKLFLPVWKRLFAVAHKYDMKTLLHSCGSIRPVLGNLVDAGLDILEVVQITTVDMEAAELKKEFGKHLTFYGAIDTQQVLPYGTSEEVRSEVRRVIDILGKDGRYILSSMHILQKDVPTENVIAMFDEAQTYQPNQSRKKDVNMFESTLDRHKAF